MRLGLLGGAAQRGGLLGIDLARYAQAAGAGRQQPAAQSGRAPEPRVSGWRVLDGILGGRTASESLDAERDRVRAEAMRPEMERQRQEILASITDPRERALYLSSPDDWAENVGYQFRPRTLAPGSVERVGGQTVGAAPVIERFDDRFGIIDPMSPQAGASYTAPRGPTFEEETGRLNATAPVNIAPGGRLVSPVDGREIAVGAPRVFSAADGAQLYDEQGRPIAENVRDAPPVDPQDAERQRRSAAYRQSFVENLTNAIDRVRPLVSGWTTGVLGSRNPFTMQSRADMRAHIDTIQGNLSFDALAEMRANSPTGGALGGVAVRELDLLGSTVAALSPDMSPEAFLESLDLIEQSARRWSEAVAQAEAESGAPNRAALEAEARRRGLIQ